MVYYLESERLCEIVEERGWQLYDVTALADNSLETFERMTPSEHYKIGHQYLFLPHRNGGSLESVMQRNNNYGPFLQIPSVHQDWFIRVEGQRFEVDKVKEIKMLVFNKRLLAAVLPINDSRNPNHITPNDLVCIKNNKIIDVWEKYFSGSNPELG